MARPGRRAGLLRVPRAGPRHGRAVASPARSARRTASSLADAKPAFRAAVRDYVADDDGVDEAGRGVPSRPPTRPAANAAPTAPAAPSRSRSPLADGTTFEIDHGAVVIAAITSCTNTSNPQVMIGAALLAKNAVEKGLTRKPWVKTTLAPGSKVVMDYYERAGLDPVPGQARLQPGRLRLHHLHRQLRPAARGDLRGGQRARPRGRLGALRQPQLRGPDQPGRQDELPGLAAAGGRLRPRRHDGHRPGQRAARAPTPTASRSSCATSGRRSAEIQDVIASAIGAEMFSEAYADVFAGDERWQSLPTPTGNTFEWDADSTYVRKPPYFEGMPQEPPRSPTSPAPGCWPSWATRSPPTTSRRPARSRPTPRPASTCAEHGVERQRLQLLRLAPRQPRGDDPRHLRQHPAAQPARARASRAATPATHLDRRADRPSTTPRGTTEAGIPLVILAGKEYGSGSSRDWAAKGTALLGVRAVIAESYERIHRSNLIGMGVLPLQFPAGADRRVARADRQETFAITGVDRAQRRRHPAHRQGHAPTPASSSTRWCASTPPVRRTTTATAASCSTCCAA